MLSAIKKMTFSPYLLKAWVWMAIINIIVGHLSQPEFFPLNEGYQFPLIPILAATLLGTVILLIADLNFQYFKRQYFIESVTVRNLIAFYASTLAYITILYIIVYISINGLQVYNVYYLLSGLLVTLVLWSLGIVLVYGAAIYKLYKFTHVEGKLKIESGGKIILIGYDEIAFAHSKNKIAYVVKNDGTAVPSDFTLNEIEEKVNAHHFYRANRQTILHASSVEKVQSIENGKLTVQLKSVIGSNEPLQLTISRYKKQEFLNWFENVS